MVFLTRHLLYRRFYQPHHDRSWKKEMQNRLTWHFYGRRRNCYALQKDAIRRSLRFATVVRSSRRRHVNYIFSDRIAAGCAQHGVQYSSFMRSLYENNIAIDKKVLSSLAVYEPRTFQSLCEFVKKQHTEKVYAGLAASVEPTPSGIVTREMVDKVYKS
ncbi:50S ribosomal protein L20 [Aplysia californica]|uniref:50S ribosomal protein L20 n=1 Tax=Aplysia californica TaxID=6500 RepID=A0ABM0JQ47_APLCA|nr:50S ribosomal protein L20 [Aplysia californica]